MDELSWQSQLVQAGINITHYDPKEHYIYFDFAYRPKSGGQRVWGKSLMKIYEPKWVDAAEELRDFVRSLREELEG